MTGEGSYGSASWFVKHGQEEAFIAAWKQLLDLAHRTTDGFRSAKLLRDDADPSHFVSVAEFADDEARSRWRAHPDFAESIKACMELCENSNTGTFSLAATG